MKKTLLFFTLILLCTIGYAVIGQKTQTLSPKQEKREAREKRRADRQAAYEKTIDSIILAHTFQFNPQSMQRQPAGPMQLINNPNANVGVWDGTVDIFLPYIKGITPPYRTVLINYTVPSVQNYVSEQTPEGWTVTFETSLFSATTYTFTFEISTKSGGTVLTIQNPWYNTVQYNGSISQIY